MLARSCSCLLSLRFIPFFVLFYISCSMSHRYSECWINVFWAIGFFQHQMFSAVSSYSPCSVPSWWLVLYREFNKVSQTVLKHLSLPSWNLFYKGPFLFAIQLYSRFFLFVLKFLISLVCDGWHGYVALSLKTLLYGMFLRPKDNLDIASRHVLPHNENVSL